MAIYLFPIQTAIIIFFLLSFLIFVPWLIYSYRKYGYLSIWSSIVVYSFIFYMLTALFLVILPLPEIRDTCSLQEPGTRHFSFVPFQFVHDIFKSSSIIWNQPKTYAQLLTGSAFLQAAFNFLLLMPFGVYLRYFWRVKSNWKKAFAAGLGLSLFFEVTQGTGLYGIYHCPYRIFDVDDLLLNSTGALVGFLIAPIILALFPSQKDVQAKTEKVEKTGYVSPGAQLLAVLIDYYLIKVVWFFFSIFFTDQTVLRLLFFTFGFLFVYLLVPLNRRGKTFGTGFFYYRLMKENGTIPHASSLFSRTVALYLPWFFFTFLQTFTQLEIPMDSAFYPFQIWMTVLLTATWYILWIVLFVHAAVVLFAKGKRTFYFDHAAGLLPKRE